MEGHGRSLNRRPECRWPGSTPRAIRWWGRFANHPYAGETEFREQSQNVYENKEQGKEVERSGSWAAEADLKRHLSIFRPIGGRGGSRTTPYVGCAEFREQSQNVYENKG